MKRQMLFFFVLSLCLSYVNAQPEPKVPNCDPIVVTDNFPFYESFEGEDLGC